MASQTKRHFWTYFALAAALICFAIPLFLSGFYDDDMLLYFFVGGTGFLEKISPFSYALTEVKFYYDNLGRITPLTQIIYSLVFTNYPNLILYKLYIISMIGICIYTFKQLLVKLNISKNNALLLSIIPVFLFQFRQYHDPVTSYYAIMPFFLIINTLSWSFFIEYLNKNKKRFLILSGLLYIIALLTYEIAVLFIIIYPLLAWKMNKHIKLKELIYQSQAQLMIVITYVLYYLIYNASIPTTTHAHYAGLTINPDPIKVITTLFLQAGAAFPLSNLSEYIVTPSSLTNNFNLWFLILSIIPSIALYYFFSNKKIDRQAKPDNIFIILLGLSLLLLPALLIALSQKYQIALYPGIGYLPVYIEYFGLTLILWPLIAKYPKIFALAISIIFFIHINNNFLTVGQRNRDVMLPMKVFKEAINQGKFKDIPENSLLVFNSDYMYCSTYTGYLAEHTGKRFQVSAHRKGTDPWPKKAFYYIDYDKSTAKLSISYKPTVL